GGIYKLVEALISIGKKYGVTYKTRTSVTNIVLEGERASGVIAGGKHWPADVVVSNADLHHTESELTSPKYRDHTERYWQKRRTSPSALLLYLGVNRRYDNLLHHTLLFSDDWRHNFEQIFDEHTLPDNPSLYICAPSRTDPGIAPKGHECIFVLVPLPAGISVTRQALDAYTSMTLEMLETKAGLTGLRGHVTFKKVFAPDDFARAYNNFRGSGLGLAHNLMQTAVFRPSNKSRKAKNVYYVGADVHPGIGMPSVLISAELTCRRIVLDSLN
ncbi:MAG TPA: phytoene desaturase family protein, partial [Candidatus Saccharimonadales bacterium]|nr:phytoene desaturase family protein [Candidatus Saccharimonadales bacterium]